MVDTINPGLATAKLAITTKSRDRRRILPKTCRPSKRERASVRENRVKSFNSHGPEQETRTATIYVGSCSPKYEPPKSLFRSCSVFAGSPSAGSDVAVAKVSRTKKV